MAGQSIDYPGGFLRGHARGLFHFGGRSRMLTFSHRLPHNRCPFTHNRRQLPDRRPFAALTALFPNTGSTADGPSAHLLLCCPVEKLHNPLQRHCCVQCSTSDPLRSRLPKGTWRGGATGVSSRVSVWLGLQPRMHWKRGGKGEGG